MRGMSALTEDQRRALERMHETFPTLEAWRVRSREVEQPERGSEAAEDDTIWPYQPPSEIVRQSLVAATQHLNLARCQWPVGLPCGRSRDVLVGGHVISLLVAS